MANVNESHSCFVNVYDAKQLPFLVSVRLSRDV